MKKRVHMAFDIKDPGKGPSPFPNDTKISVLKLALIAAQQRFSHLNDNEAGIAALKFVKDMEDILFGPEEPTD
jgi:hypothetical protein